MFESCEFIKAAMTITHSHGSYVFELLYCVQLLLDCAQYCIVCIVCEKAIQQGLLFVTHSILN